MAWSPREVRRWAPWVALLALCGCGSAGADGDAGGLGGGAPDAAVSADAGQPDAGADAVIQALLERLATPAFEAARDAGPAVGLVVGAWTPAGSAFAGLGLTARDGGVRPGPDTLFEIGSVTKAVTGLLFAVAVEQGRLPLEGPLAPWFDGGVPSGTTRGITLLDLATHTSGLPDWPTNLHGTPLNPGAGYSEQDLAAFLAGASLGSEPGVTYVYSNVGSGALGHVLVRAAGRASYAELVTADLAPLGLVDTVVTMTAEQAARAARGHRAGQPAPPNDIGAPLQAAGALRASARDLLRVVASGAGGQPAALASAWTAALQPYRPSPFGTDGHAGLLWNSEAWSGRVVYSKNGQTAGFSAQVMLTTSPPAGVVLLSNAKELGDIGVLRRLGLDVLAGLPPP